MSLSCVCARVCACVCVYVRVCVCVSVHALSAVRLFAYPWTVGWPARLYMGFSRQEYWSGLPCPPPGDLPDLGIKSASLASPASAGRFFIASNTSETQGLYLHLFSNWTFSPIFRTSFASALSCLESPHPTLRLVCFRMEDTKDSSIRLFTVNLQLHARLWIC